MKVDGTLPGLETLIVALQALGGSYISEEAMEEEIRTPSTVFTRGIYNRIDHTVVKLYWRFRKAYPFIKVTLSPPDQLGLLDGVVGFKIKPSNTSLGCFDKHGVASALKIWLTTTTETGCTLTLSAVNRGYLEERGVASTTFNVIYHRI